MIDDIFREDPFYMYFIDKDGDIISVSKPQGGKHSEIGRNKPRSFKIVTKKKKKIKSEPCGTGLIDCYYNPQQEEFKGTFKEI